MSNFLCLSSVDVVARDCTCSITCLVDKSNELTDQQDILCCNHVSACYTSRATTSCKMLNYKFKAQIITGNPIGNYRCHLLASCALNMLCSFSQLACSVDIRCMVNAFYDPTIVTRSRDKIFMVLFTASRKKVNSIRKENPIILKAYCIAIKWFKSMLLL